MAGSSTVNEAPALYYDVGSPDAYLAAERVVGVLGTVPEFVPVRIGLGRDDEFEVVLARGPQAQLSRGRASHPRRGPLP